MLQKRAKYRSNDYLFFSLSFIGVREKEMVRFNRYPAL